MTLADRLRRVTEALPPDASVTLTAATLRAWLAEEPQPADVPAVVAEPDTWRTKLWTVPDATRLGVHELAEALDRSADWVYRAVNQQRASARGRQPLPCSRLDGCLSFTAGAVRRWLEANERVVHAEPRRLALSARGSL